MTIRVGENSFLFDDTYSPPRVVGFKQANGDESYFAFVSSVPANQLNVPVEPQGRLTLATATPVTITDQASKTVLYYTPHKGNMVPVYDGTSMVPTVFAELSNDTTASATGKAGPAAVTTSKAYDLFVWNDAGTVRLTRGPAWTDDTTRSASLTLTQGVYLNTAAITNGPDALRGTYVGTVYSDGSSQLNDTLAKRHVWNNYNRARRPMQVFDTTNSWTYTTATVRQANGAAANQLDYVCGLAEDAVVAEVAVDVYNDNAAGVLFTAGVGVDSTTVISGTHPLAQNIAASRRTRAGGTYRGVPGLGRHFLAWLEYSGAGTGTTTWGGDNGAVTYQSGITGEVWG